jgi:hypothetical protein
MSQDEKIQRVIDGRAWTEFCRALEAAGQTILREGTPATPLDRAEGLRYLTRLLRAGLDANLEHGDPRFPHFHQLSNETVKIGNDNPDNIYWNCKISGQYEYKLTGLRGSVPYVSLCTKGGGYEKDGTMTPHGQLDGRDMKINADGSFEIAVSCEPRPGNWLPMKPETNQLMIRITFGDRSQETPATFAIERVGASGVPQLDPAALEDTLQRTVGFVRGTANLFVDWMTGRYATHVNQLPSDDQKTCQAVGGDAQIHYLQSRWQLAEDEALWIRPTRIPECAFWNFQLSNFWMESLDYRYARIHTNKVVAHYEPDGSVRIVVAHRDPGPRFKNWLTTCGHTSGGMLFRWVEAKEFPPVETRVVKLSELNALP